MIVAIEKGLWKNFCRVIERSDLASVRGPGAMEFGGFGIEMSDTRDLFVEKAETVVNALKNGYIVSTTTTWNGP